MIMAFTPFFLPPFSSPVALLFKFSLLFFFAAASYCYFCSVCLSAAIFYRNNEYNGMVTEYTFQLNGSVSRTNEAHVMALYSNKQEQ